MRVSLVCLLVVVFLCEFSTAYQTIRCQERTRQFTLTARRRLDSETYGDFVSSYSVSASHGKKISKALFATVAAVASSSVWPNRQALAATTPATRPLLSDEVEIEIIQQFLGVGLQESKYGDEYRVLVQSVKPDAEAVTKEKIREGKVITTVQTEWLS